ncbi:MAG: hypothetical protein K1X54_07800 [Flavobacteriales bacterium]|nr:hypothetical protein [Flavobacteriales bacterium]
MKKYICEYVLLLAVMMVVASCGVKAPAASGGRGDGFVKIFTKGKDSLLCFGGPIKYEATGNRDEFSIDHTYLKVKDKSNPVTCNFSVITEDNTFRPEKITLELSGVLTDCGKPEKIYAEGYGKKSYIYRYSFSVSDSLFYQWMQNEKPVITVNDRKFTGGKKFRKGSEAIFRSFLFDLYLH